MRKYKGFVKRFLIGWLREMRSTLGLTQEKMSESLRMSVRSYTDIERGKSGFSATTLLFFLSLLKDEEILRLVHDFREGIKEEEDHEAI